MRCVDIFSGAGGLSIGLDRAGFRTVAAVDFDRDSCDTYSTIFPEVDLRNAPVENVDFKPYKNIDLLAGGPPCQPFSSGGKRLASQDRRDCIPEFVRAVEEANPRAFILENVPGLVAREREPYFRSLLKRLAGLGYTVTRAVLNSADYGVPQKRRRLFVVGLKEGDFYFPAASHGPQRETPYVPAGRFIKAQRAIGEPNLSKIVYAKRPDLRPRPYDGHLLNGGGRPINLPLPRHTILASAGGNKTHFIDGQGLVPEYHAHLAAGGKPRVGLLPGARRLTVVESALLQTFPVGMKLSGSRSSQYTQVGNAVPPLLAAVLGESIFEMLSIERRRASAFSTSERSG